jgi:hypothetical protein
VTLHTPKNWLMMATIITSSNYIHFNPFYNKKFPGCLSTCPWTSWLKNPCFSILAKPCTLNSHPLRLPHSVPLVCNVRRRQANVTSDSRSWTYVNCECWQEPKLSVTEWRISSSSDYHMFTALKNYRGDPKTGWILWHDGWYHNKICAL